MKTDRFDHKVDLTVDHKGDELRRVEVITGVGRRRNWSSAFKAMVVAESAEPGAVISAVARRHGLTPQQLFSWRNQMRSLPSANTEAVSFASVMMAPDAPDPTSHPEGYRDERGMIEIVLKGTVIRVRVGVSAETLTAVLRAVKATS